MAIERQIETESPPAMAERLLAEIKVLREARRYRLEVAARVRVYEEQFGLPSAEIHQAIDRGDLVETLAVCKWIMDYEWLTKLDDAGE